MKPKAGIYAVASGIGCYLPPRVVDNAEFASNRFYNADGSVSESPGSEIVDKFRQITDIAQRRLTEKNHVTSDLAVFAAQNALKDAGFDPEKLDYIIVAHNLGDMRHGVTYPDMFQLAALFFI